MKILSIGNFTTGWDGSICDEEHIAKALEDLGHDVMRFQRENTLSMPEMVGDYDFALIAQWGGYPADLVDRLQRPVVYWAFDHQDPNQEWHRRLVYSSDLYLSKRLDDQLNFPDKKWRWLPQDFAPSFLDTPTEPIDKDIQVLFTGSWVPWDSGQERVKILKAIDKEYDLHIYGVTPDQWRAEGFENVHGPVMDHALPELIARAKINFSMDHTYSPGYWSDRNAQIMCCGGFVLFRHVPMSEIVFKDKVAYFYNEADALNKIGYYLDNLVEREEIALRGYDYAQNNLKVVDRVQQMLVLVGGVL